MPPKPPRRTRERILETASTMFNQFGEPTVATTSIAFEMGISPGNLYYHYHSKKRSSRICSPSSGARSRRRSAAPEKRLPNAEDCWLFLHLVFEAIWKYRFIYRDVNDLVARYHVIEVQFRRILAHKIRVAEQILGGLVKGGQMRAEPAEITTLAQNIVLVASYWMSFEFARDPRAIQDDRTLGARSLSRHRARRALSRAARARIVRSPGEALHLLRRTPWPQSNGSRSRTARRTMPTKARL